jgi:hypothetical protein
MKWILRSLGWIYIAGMMVSVLAIALRPVVSAVSVRKLFVILCGTVFLTPVTAIVAVWCSSTLSRSEKWVRTREFTIGVSCVHGQCVVSHQRGPCSGSTPRKGKAQTRGSGWRNATVTRFSRSRAPQKGQGRSSRAGHDADVTRV